MAYLRFAGTESGFGLLLTQGYLCPNGNPHSRLNNWMVSLKRTAGQTSSESSTSRWLSRHCCRVLIWPGWLYIILTIICCSTGAAFTAKVSYFPVLVNRRCFPSPCLRNKLKTTPLRPPEQKICPVKHCVANGFFHAVLCWIRCVPRRGWRSSQARNALQPAMRFAPFDTHLGTASVLNQ